MRLTFKLNVFPVQKEDEELCLLFSEMLEHSRATGEFDDILNETEKKIKRRSEELIDTWKKESITSKIITIPEKK